VQRQNQFLREVGSQIRVIKLQGQIFFGTASQCEAKIRTLLEAAEWKNKPVRYLILDFTLVSGKDICGGSMRRLIVAKGVDFSAAEAFLRIQRLCAGRGVLLILCGCKPNSAVGRALRAVDLWADKEDLRVEVFENLNATLEVRKALSAQNPLTSMKHCENSLLRSLYASDLAPPAMTSGPEAPLVGIAGAAATPPRAFHDDLTLQLANSPRRMHLYEAAKDKMGLGHTKDSEQEPKIKLAQPLQLLVSALSSFAPEITDAPSFFQQVAPYFTRMHVESGTVLWENGDLATAFYLIEAGILRASSEFEGLGHHFVETMLPARCVSWSDRGQDP
jgi:SulP family sulfate permease